MTSDNRVRPLWLRMALAVIIAAVLGPFIAGLMVFLGIVSMLVVQELTHEVAPLLHELLLMTILGAYVVGFYIALAAGVLIALWMACRPPRLAVVVGASLIASIAGYSIGGPGVSTEFTADRSLVVKEFGMTVGLSFAAAVICWFLMRRFVRTA